MAPTTEGAPSPSAKHTRKPRSKPAKRYSTDLTDAQWALIEPLLPPPAASGRAEKHPRREIVNAILYLDRAGCAWRLLPKCFPPWETVYWHWARWKNDATTDRVHDALRDRLRDAAGRDPMASAGVIDSQSLRAADTVGADQRGYDAGKRTNGTKRHIVTDTLGLLLVVLVTAASAARPRRGPAPAGSAAVRDAQRRVGVRRWRLRRAPGALGQGQAAPW